MKERVIFIDTETTGIDTENCGVYQIAGIIDIDGEIKEKFNIFCNIFPGDFIEDGVLKLHGKEKIDKISTYQSPRKAYAQFVSILEKYVDKYDPTDKFISIGYVADFDNRVLRRFFKRNNDEYFGSYFWHPWIDIMNLAAYMYQDKRHLFQDFKLGTVCQYAGIEIGDRPLHDASVDIEITRELYYQLTK